MAIRYFHVDVLSANDGDSAVGLSAYLDRARRRDETLGETFDMTRHAKPFDAAAYIAREARYSGHHEDVVHACVMLPDGCNPSFLDPQILWSRAHKAELVVDRKTGDIRFRSGATIAKHGVGALAKELTLEQAIECARGFVQQEIVDKGLIAQLAVHRAPMKYLHDGTALSTGNIHFHVLWTLRRPEGTGFGNKARDLEPKFGKFGTVVEGNDWNQKWEDYQNAYFARLGLSLRVDQHAAVPRIRLGKAAYLKQSWKRKANEEIAAIEARMMSAIEFERGRLASHISQSAEFNRQLDIERLEENTANIAEVSRKLGALRAKVRALKPPPAPRRTRDDYDAETYERERREAQALKRKEEQEKKAHAKVPSRPETLPASPLPLAPTTKRKLTEARRRELVATRTGLQKLLASIEALHAKLIRVAAELVIKVGAGGGEDDAGAAAGPRGSFTFTPIEPVKVPLVGWDEAGKKHAPRVRERDDQ